MIIKSLIQNWPLIWSRRPRSLSGSQKNAVAAPKRHTNTHTHSRKHTHHTLGKYHTRNWPYGNVWAGKCGNSRLWRFATERTPTRIYFRRIAWAVLSGASAFFCFTKYTHTRWMGCCDVFEVWGLWAREPENERRRVNHFSGLYGIGGARNGIEWSDEQNVSIYKFRTRNRPFTMTVEAELTEWQWIARVAGLCFSQQQVSNDRAVDDDKHEEPTSQIYETNINPYTLRWLNDWHVHTHTVAHIFESTFSHVTCGVWWPSRAVYKCQRPIVPSAARFVTSNEATQTQHIFIKRRHSEHIYYKVYKTVTIYEMHIYIRRFV